MDREWDEGEPVAGNGVADLVHDLWNGDELVCALGKLLSTFDNGVGVDYGHGYAFGGVAGLSEDADRGVRVRVLRLGRCLVFE